MYFIKFPVAATNIFPAANGVNGSQLLTEWNLRSRESVAAPADIQYDVGLSYAHSMSDYEVSILTDDDGVQVNSYTLGIAPGKAIINGHFVQCLTQLSIDLVQANAERQAAAMPALSGYLAVGIRAFYATEETIAGSLLVENDDDMYLGVQLVVLPDAEMVTPEDSPTDESKVNTHLKLATFYFTNNSIQSLRNDPHKIQFMSPDRVTDIDSIVSSKYITKLGLNPKKLYAFAGKGTDPSTGYDTWEDVTDSEIIWDAFPERTTATPAYRQAQFVTTDAKMYLCAPHKQIEGMETDLGEPEYYAPRLIEVPVADYALNTPGIVNRAYTQQIKRIGEKVNTFHTTLTGKQIFYMETKSANDTLPKINNNWNCGDYVLVGTDYTVTATTDAVRSPSTMYVVLPGYVLTIQFKVKVDNSDEVPSSIVGAELGLLEWSSENRDPEPNTTDPELYPEFFEEGDEIRGVVGEDYFRVRYVWVEDDTSHFANYYYVVATADKRSYSDAIYVTGEIPLATETSVGGFLNVGTDATDYGYVYRDDAGRLRLLDYSLLRSGVLAYQLGEDITIPGGLSSAETQAYLTEYVNQRVAFPNATQLASASPNCIHIYLSLYAESDATTINIADIDSRFNTSVCLHIQGEATSTTVINIYDCQKIKIDSGIEGSPVINVYRSSLYYDPYVFNYIRQCARDQDSSSTFTGMEDISIWYEKFDSTDADLTVNDMTVRELDAPIIPDELSYWNVEGSAVNDNHYMTALSSITFAGNGDVIGCGLLVANDSTDNINPGEKIIAAPFELPQGSGLIYPKACMTKQLKVTGTFTSAYKSESTWYVTDTSFSALTATYDPYSVSTAINGNIAFHSKTSLIDAGISESSIPVWDTDTFHMFIGGAIS